MASLKEIRRRLKSIANTRKITYAMKLVSAAKLRKTQEAASLSREYTELLNKVMSQILNEGVSDLTHPLLQGKQEVRKVAVIVLGGARGLCGSYNSQLNKKVDVFFRDQAAKGVEVEGVIFGKKPAEHFRRTNKKYAEAHEALPEEPTKWPTDEASVALEVQFISGGYDEVYVAYTKFKSAMSMTPTIEKIMPLDPESLAATGRQTQNSDSLTLFEPGKIEVLSTIIPRIIRAKIRQAALDTKASEHASRMTAMDAATKNAKELGNALTLERNRVRQSTVTSQLLDIVGGAEALN